MKHSIYLICCSLLTSLVLANPSCPSNFSNATRLKIVSSAINIQNTTSLVYEIVLEDGSKILKRKRGDCFHAIVENQTSIPTCLHLYGLIAPNSQDGVPYVTQTPILPGKSYSYHFPIDQTGSYFAHSLYGLQEQKLMSIPILFLSEEKDSYRDVILFLEDFTFHSLDVVWKNLRKDCMQKKKVMGPNWKPELLNSKAKSKKSDLNEVSFDAYLTNRNPLGSSPVQWVRAGEEVRLRLINGSTASHFHLDLGLLQGKLIAVDGNHIHPFLVRRFPLATAQRADVIVTIPSEGGVFPILAQAEGTKMLTGLVLATEGNPVSPINPMADALAEPITNVLEKSLHAAQPFPDKNVDRSLIVELEGNMQYYTWALNRGIWPYNFPLFVREGERVEMEFNNKTGIAHPMHLHGHIFQIIEIDGERFSGALRDTVLVMPYQTVRVQFDANHPGIWALHCPIAYRSWGGMFTVLQYEGFKVPQFPLSTIIKYSQIHGGF